MSFAIIGLFMFNSKILKFKKLKEIGECKYGFYLMKFLSSRKISFDILYS